MEVIEETKKGRGDETTRAFFLSTRHFRRIALISHVENVGKGGWMEGLAIVWTYARGRLGGGLKPKHPELQPGHRGFN